MAPQHPSIVSRARFLLLVLLLSLVAAFLAALFWPRTTPLALNPNVFTGHYWGFDRIGRHYYRVTAKDRPYGHWEVDVSKPGYSPYRGYYPDGTLREEGEIYVDFMGRPPEPCPETDNVKWGKYYRPDGVLGAEIRNGTGEQMFWFPNGKVRWRLVLDNYKRVFHEHWRENGELISAEEYGDRD